MATTTETRDSKSTKSTDREGAITSKLTVALRIRPLKKEELLRGESRVAHVVEEKMVVLIDPQDDRFGMLRQNKRPQERTYVFDFAFDGDSAQEVVYQNTTQPLVDSVMNGFNATVFAYGATGTGKTYTMVGTDKDPGIMVRALNELFRRVEENSDDLSYKVTMSYLEIYNEMIRDLLNPSSGYLELREDAKKVQVVGLTEVSTNSTKEVIKLLTKGNRARTMESTSANQTSSRSHALLEVIVRQQSRVRNTLEEVQAGKLYMIDLAGSERASNTQNRGKRLVEGAHINRSLLALGNCINALADKGSKYVNYRDSKLTRLLKDALSGNCRTVMIAHIGPAASNFDESRNTLVYADRAKNIRNKVRRNVVDVTYHVAQYQTIIDELRQEITRLKTKANTPLDPNLKEQRLKGPNAGENRKENPEEMLKLKDDLVKTFNEQMELRRQLMEIDAHVLELSIEFEKQSLVVGEWEAERSKGTSDRDLKRSDLDVEPAHVRQAWDDLMFIQDEQQRYWDIRKDVERQFRDCQNRASRIEEELPYRIGGNDQKDLLLLLCKVHELEIEKMEMQAETLLKEHELLRKDMIILRYGRQRNLSNEIIQRQKVIIDGNQIALPQELQELYNQYKAEMEEINHREKAVRSAMPKALFPELDPLTATGASRRRSIVKKLPLLTEENDRFFLRRTTVPDTGSGPKARVAPVSRSSVTAPNPSIPGTAGLLPPIEARNRSNSSGDALVSMKDSIKNINTVAARRRSVRTAEKKNLETWQNNWMKTGKSRGSSVANDGVPFSLQGYGGPTNPVLHRRRGLQNPAHFFNDPNSNNRLPWYSMDNGSDFPKPVVYYPPNRTPPEFRHLGPDGSTETIPEGIGRFTVGDASLSAESPVEHLSLTVTSLPTTDQESSGAKSQQAGSPTSTSPINLGPIDGSHRLPSVAEAST